MSDKTGASIEPCRCGYFEASEDDEDMCACGHVRDEHSRSGECQVGHE